LLPAENDRLWQLIKDADLTAVPSSKEEAAPDTAMYTFTLMSGHDEHITTIWSTEVQENQAVQALLNGLAEVVKSHTGKDIVLR
jgi:hypothetical protein